MGIILATVVVFFVVMFVWVVRFMLNEAGILCPLYAWSPANCLSRLARTTSTGIASNSHEHQTQSATATSNVTAVVEIEQDTPLPPDVPPPYSPLYFPEQPPPSYNELEAPRNSETMA